MIFLDGFLTGLILQVAIGPVFFYILNLSLQRSLQDGYAAVLAAVLVDYLYITLAVLGVGRLLENEKVKRILGLISAVVLGIFGWLMIGLAWKGEILPGSVNPGGADYTSSFLTTFLLTISSPLTIVFWTSIFASKAVEKGYSKKELIPFGIASGLATLCFLGLSVTGFSYIIIAIPENLIRNLNLGVGVTLIFYGLVRLVKLLNKAPEPDQKPPRA